MTDAIGLASLPGSHQAAAQGLVDRGAADSIALSARVLKTSTEGAHPLILDFTRAFLKDLKARGFPFFPHSFFRSGKVQNELYHQGVSKARAGQSAHNFGMAVDLVHYRRLWGLTEKEWSVIGLIGKEVARRRNIKVTWGGDWSFYDPAHWELRDWKKMRHEVDEWQPEPGQSFGQAFAQARKEGRDTFRWNGDLFTTDLA